MKIISLTSENIKKLSVVEIRPDGNLVQITGANGQGKTSVLDSIWWALAGVATVQAMPIRKGASQARVRLDLGEVIVTRIFRLQEGGEVTTDLKVETAEGARFPSPQKLLDSFLASLAFDPLAFTRMDPRKQFDELRRFVPGVDFAAIDRANKADFEERTGVKRDAKGARAAADAITLAADLPAAPVDEVALVNELQAALEHNGQVDLRAERRRQAAERIEELAADIVRIDTETPRRVTAAEAECAEAVSELHRQIALLQSRITQAQDRCISVVRGIKAEAEAGRAGLEAQHADLQAKLDAADALPAAIDVGPLRAAVDSARSVNAAIQRRTERDRLLARATALDAQAAALTEAMEKRETDKKAAVAAAKLPVPGIGFGDGVILLNDVPFDQASDAEQLRASVAIAAAGDPKLRVIRVRDGSLLDTDGMALLADIATERDFQIWVERVDASGTVGFVLENGHLAGVEPPEQAAEPEPARKPRKAAGAPVEETAAPEADQAPPGAATVAEAPPEQPVKPAASKRAGIVRAGAPTADLVGGK